ncbi:MAG: family 16 glycosylhydrolase [Bacteroidales bacterium]|nr:family 16 glycosylhydrolase [Bacteroidales bacterium]
MKKFILFNAILLLNMNMMSQIDLNDKNWGSEPVFYDNFDETNRQFDNTFQEPLGKWISYSKGAWPSGVTKPSTNQVYQWWNCSFNSNNETIKLHCLYEPNSPLQCGSYDIAPLQGWHCDYSHQDLYYYSGIIETPTPLFRYGYFEIRCQLPVHKGAFPAFWLWDAKNSNQSNDPHYEEIDIFEFSWNIGESPNWIGNPNPHGLPDPYTFTTGIYFNDNSPTPYTSYARNFPTLPDGSLDLSNWHVFSCEWMPDYVRWYCDGILVNEFYESYHIPHRPLTLKTNYAVDGKYKYNNNIWTGSGDMIVDYIKVYQLNWDCDNDETINSQYELDNFVFAVKKTVLIDSPYESITVDNSKKITFRIADSFTVTGEFQVDSGAEFTVIRQSCPE